MSLHEEEEREKEKASQEKSSQEKSSKEQAPQDQEHVHDWPAVRIGHGLRDRKGKGRATEP